MVQGEHAPNVGHLDLDLDERCSDEVHIRFDLRLRITLEDVLLDALHIAHDATEFARTAVEPLAQVGERAAVHFVCHQQEGVRFLSDALDGRGDHAAFGFGVGHIG